MTEHKCTKCGEICPIDGEYPKFFAWCNTCGTYAEGFDIMDYAADYMASQIDYAYDMMKDRMLDSID